MTSGTSQDIREVVFVNRDAKKEFDDFAPQVKEMAESRLSILQNGGKLPSNQVRRLKEKLSGISEIRISYDDDSYRVYYTVEFMEVIIILDAGMKKSPRDGEIPRWQVERLEHRLAQVRIKYAENIDTIRRRFEARAKAREGKLKPTSVNMIGSLGI